MSEWVEAMATPADKPGSETGVALTRQMISGRSLVAALSLYCLLVALIFHDTLASMVAIWIRSETFAHGFLILPISLWLAWRRRDRFYSLEVRPQPLAMLLVLGAGLTWLLANLVDVLVVQQLAFVAVLVSGIWSIAGTAVVRCYAFPLGFLFLAVPMGEGLIPPLMELTADTTEYLVRASGVPIYREGMYLNLPTGTWSVIEECSGVRYLIASVTLGLCYAHLTYISLWRQLAFVVAAIIVPILANSARAYAVVMVGHLSDMRYGIGADHLVFGWAFFGVIMLLMFWIGGFWQEKETAPASDTATTAQTQRPSLLSLSLFSAMVIICASIWPALSLTMHRNAGPADTMALSTPVTSGAWQAVDGADWRWHPAQPGADRELDQVFISGDSPSSVSVSLHLRQYLQQHQGVELVNNNDPWRPDRRNWRVIGHQRSQVDLGRPVQVDEVRVSSGRDNLLVWSWYRVDDRYTASPYLVKLLEAKQQLMEGQRQGTRVFIATPMGEDRQAARTILQDFISSNLAAIESALAGGMSNDATSSEARSE